MSKILIVYYSLTGNNKFIAEAIKEEMDADILAIKPVKELNPEKSTRFFWGGYQANMKKKPKLEPFDTNPLDYDLIILGFPVWSWTFSPPTRTFINNYDLTDKKVALWSCSAGGTEKGLDKIKIELEGAKILGELNLKDPLKDKDASREKAVKWARGINNIFLEV